MIIVKLIFLAILLLTQANFSEVRYVSKTGSSTPPYTSWETASDSIQKCINISNFGDTIYVGNGVYKEKVVMIPGLALIGAGMDSCVIDTRTLATPQNFYSLDMQEYCSVEGFHIIVRNNPGAGSGTGIHLYLLTSDSVHFQGTIKQNKISSANTGLGISYASLRIYGNIISNAIEGVRVLAAFNPVYDTIYNNYMLDIYNLGIYTEISAKIIAYKNAIHLTDLDGIAIANSGGSEIYNNLIIGGKRGIISNPMQQSIYNNLMINNSSLGIQFYNNDTIKNNLIVNSWKGLSLWEGSTNYITKFNNSWNNNYNYYGFTPDSTNLSVDPMFVDEDSMDYHLQMYSPLIDAGDPDILDKDGSRSDIGLYGGPLGEITAYQDLPPKAPKGLKVSADSSGIILSWKKNTEADFRSYYVYFDSVPGFAADTLSFLAELTDTFFVHNLYVKYKRVYYKLRAVDNQSNLSIVSDEVGVILVSNDEKPQIVQEYVLYQNYPNPFNPSTKIPFRLKERGYVKLYVYDIKGELVSVLVNEEKQAGYYEVEFNPGEREYKDIASGIYIYQIDVKSSSSRIPVFRDIKKMIFIK